MRRIIRQRNGAGSVRDGFWLHRHLVSTGIENQVVDAKEIASGFSELNDPEDQPARFLEQVKLKEAGGGLGPEFSGRGLRRGFSFGAPHAHGLHRLVAQPARIRRHGRVVSR